MVHMRESEYVWIRCAPTHLPVEKTSANDNEVYHVESGIASKREPPVQPAGPRGIESEYHNRWRSYQTDIKSVLNENRISIWDVVCLYA